MRVGLVAGFILTFDLILAQKKKAPHRLSPFGGFQTGGQTPFFCGFATQFDTFFETGDQLAFKKPSVYAGLQ